MKSPKLVRYNICSDKLSDIWTGYKIAFFADYHNNDYGIDEEQVFRLLQKFKPDCLMIAGDSIVAKPGKNNDNAYSFLKRLADKYKIYYSNGNHEYRARIYPDIYGDMYNEFLENIKHDNIIHLVNDKSFIVKNEEKIVVKGLEIDAYFYDRFKKHVMTGEYINGLLGERSDDFEIMLAHNPKYFSGYAQYGSDLILAGHVHGGLVRLPLVGGVVSPDISFFPQYDYGIYKEKESTMLLTSGLGAHTIKLRLFNPPQIMAITLQGGSNGNFSKA